MTLRQRFLKDESGATAIEYGLIAGLVSIAIIAALNLLQVSLTDVFTMLGEALSAAIA